MTDNNITIFAPKNVQTISELAPQSYNENSLSHLRCLEAGTQLLDRVNRDGMSDALDIDIAKFIEKAKLTVKKMYGKRTPVTQLFDMIRKAYTSLENEVDPTKNGSIPYKLQAIRNTYAQKKHEEEERLRRAEAARIAKESAITRYRAAVEEDYLRQFNALVNKSINDLTDMDRRINLDNITSMHDEIKRFDCDTILSTWCTNVTSSTIHPMELSSDECTAIQANIMAGLANRFKEQFNFEVAATRDDILDRLPSKKKELERIAKASADEAVKIKAEMEAREREEAARKDTERREREKQEAAAARLAAEKQEMDGLFGAPVSTAATYQPKTQVKKKVVIETADDIMAVVAFWWSQFGSSLSVEELTKEFKKQINFANTAANSKDNPMLINNVRYEDEVKAK